MIGRIQIETIVKENRTVLSKEYFSPPYKLMNITENKTSLPLTLMIMSSSPGILDGDEYQIDIDIKRHSALILKTQSFQRIFDMKSGAVQKTNIHIEEGGSLSFIPHPTVPHENAKYLAKNEIYLHETSTLIWGEILTCGRKNNNEIFSFTKYHTITNIYLQNKLSIRENLLMEPAIINPNNIGQLEGFTHQAGMILHLPKCNKLEIKSMIYDFLISNQKIRFGITNGPDNFLVLRMLANGAEHLFSLLHEIENNCQLLTSQKRKSNAS
jgi:urease accessory protein